MPQLKNPTPTAMTTQEGAVGPQSACREKIPISRVLQKFQADLELQRDTKPGTVIVLDEVSMVSVPQLCRLVAFIAERGCRLVVCGGRGQHSSPGRRGAVR